MHRYRVEGANESCEIHVLLNVGYGPFVAWCMRWLALLEARIQLGSEFCEQEPLIGRLGLGVSLLLRWLFWLCEVLLWGVVCRRQVWSFEGKIVEVKLVLQVLKYGAAGFLTLLGLVVGLLRSWEEVC